MQPLLAIAGLTWKAAFRFRLFLVVAVLFVCLNFVVDLLYTFLDPRIRLR